MIVKNNIAMRITGKVSRYIDASMNRATPSSFASIVYTYQWSGHGSVFRSRCSNWITASFLAGTTSANTAKRTRQRARRRSQSRGAPRSLKVTRRVTTPPATTPSQTTTRTLGPQHHSWNQTHQTVMINVLANR